MKRRIGPYTIEAKLGEGGMGSVFAARSEQGERVALKLLRHDAFLDAEVLARFGREARVLGELNHPNIVALRGMGSVPGVGEYLALEIVDGGSYADRLKRVGPLDPAEAVDVLLGLCSAVGAAHAHGILHRDLKPANVLRRGERPVLTDFGLARRQVASQQLTQTGEVLGTPAYMAPEQTGALEGGVTPATDIYGLGALLYALLTGRPPIQGKSLMDVLMRVGTDVPAKPSLARGEALPAGLDALCLRCLAKQPGDRFANVAELTDALEEVRATLGRASPRSGQTSSTATRLAAALFALAGTTLVAGVLAFGTPPTPSASPTPSPEPERDSDTALADVTGLVWDAQAYGPPSQEVARAFRALADVPPGSLTLAHCEDALEELPLATSRQRLARIDLWGQLLWRLSPPGAVYPLAPKRDWLESVVRALRWANAEVTQAEPAEVAIGRALRGQLWLLYGTRRREDWRRLSEDPWRQDVREAFADLGAALRASLPSRALRKRSGEHYASCFVELRRDNAGAPLRRRVLGDGPARNLAEALCEEFADSAFPHLLRAALDPPTKGRARLQAAIQRVTPAEQVWIAIRLGDVSGLRSAARDEDLPAGSRLQALKTLVANEAEDPLEALAQARAILESASRSRELRDLERAFLTAATTHLCEANQLDRARTLLEALPQDRAGASPELLAKWNELRMVCAPPGSALRLSLLEKALAEVEEPRLRTAWLRALPASRREDLRSGLRGLICQTRALPPDLTKLAQSAGLYTELRGLAEQFAQIEDSFPPPGSPGRRERLVILQRSLPPNVDPALRAITLGRITRSLLSSPSAQGDERAVNNAIAAMNSWVGRAHGLELGLAHSSRLQWLQALRPLLTPQQRRATASQVVESASYALERGARNVHATAARLRWETLYAQVSELPPQSPRLGTLLKAARAATDADLEASGYEAKPLLGAAKLAHYAGDPEATRNAAEAALALLPPRLELELPLRKLLAALDVGELGPLQAARRFEAGCSQPGQALTAEKLASLRFEFAASRAHLLKVAGRAQEALEVLGEIEPPKDPAERASFLRTRALNYRALGKSAEAVADLEAALELTPSERFMIDLELSDAYAGGGDAPKARHHWLRAQRDLALPERLHAIHALLLKDERDLAGRLLDSLDDLPLSPGQAEQAERLRGRLRAPGGAARERVPTRLSWPEAGGPQSERARRALAKLEAAGPYLTPGIASLALEPLFEGGAHAERRAALELGLELFDQLSFRSSLIEQRVSASWVRGMVRLLNEANRALRERSTPSLLALRGRLWLLFGACRRSDWRLVPGACEDDVVCALIDLRLALQAPLPESSEARERAGALQGEPRRQAWRALYSAVAWRGPTPTADELLQRLLAEEPDGYLGYVWSGLRRSPQDRASLLERALEQVRLPADRAKLRLELGDTKDWKLVAEDASAPSKERMEAVYRLAQAGFASERLWALASRIRASAPDPSDVHAGHMVVGELVAARRLGVGKVREAQALVKQLLATASFPVRKARLWQTLGEAKVRQGQSGLREINEALAHDWSAEAHLSKSLGLFGLGQRAQAQAHARVGLSLAREDKLKQQKDSYTAAAEHVGVEASGLLALRGEREQIAQADAAQLRTWEKRATEADDPLIGFGLMQALRKRANALRSPDFQRYAALEARYGERWRAKARHVERVLADEAVARSLMELAPSFPRSSQAAQWSSALDLFAQVLPRLPESEQPKAARLLTRCAFARAQLTQESDHGAQLLELARRDARIAGGTDADPWLLLAKLQRRAPFHRDPTRAEVLEQARALSPPRWPLAGELALALVAFARERADAAGVLEHTERGLGASAYSPRVLEHTERGLAASADSPRVSPGLTRSLVESRVLALARLGRHDEAARAHAATPSLSSRAPDQVTWEILGAHLALVRGASRRAVQILERIERRWPQAVKDRRHFLATFAFALDQAGERDRASARWRRLDALLPTVALQQGFVGALISGWNFALARKLMTRMDAAALPMNESQRTRHRNYRALLRRLLEEDQR